jgi:hypothetical protein
MTTQKKIKSIAKGLTFAILWPAAVVYVVGKKFSKFTNEVAHESLDVAEVWVKQAEEGYAEAVGQTKAMMQEAREFSQQAQKRRAKNKFSPVTVS